MTLIDHDNAYPVPLVHVADPLHSVDHQEHYRLERQNICSWYYQRSSFNFIPDVGPGVWRVIPFDAEMKNGDTYSVNHARFFPGVPGWYDLKVYFNLLLSPPLAMAITPSKIEMGVRLYEGDQPVGVYKEIAGVTNQLYGAGNQTYIREALFSGAYGIELDVNQSIEFGWRQVSTGDVPTCDYMYARFIAEKITDKYESPFQCC